jgi:lysine-specific demethylase/histidyl-hydroxylase NO66
MGKRFLSDRLPPAWTAQEKSETSVGRTEGVQILPNTKCRLARPGIARLVLEDEKAVLYHCADNSRIYHEHPLSPMEFEMDDAPALEQLLTTTEPTWVLVQDLIHDTIEDKVAVAQALFDEGIVAIRTAEDDDDEIEEEECAF